MQSQALMIHIQTILHRKDKQDFDISMSGRLEGIGARLQEDGIYIKVVEIVPGSPSYKQGELQSGDHIIAVAQGDDEVG